MSKKEKMTRQSIAIEMAEENWRERRITIELDMPATGLKKLLQHLEHDHVGNVYVRSSEKPDGEMMLDVSLTD